MTTADARSRMKARLDIIAADTSFDSLIDAFVLDAVNRLAPDHQQEVAVQTVNVTPDDYGQVTVTLSTLTTPLSEATEVEAVAGGPPMPVDSYRHHGTKLRVRGLFSDVTQLLIHGLTPYTLTTVPAVLELPVFYFAQAEFYNFLIGNKRKYDQYMQNGRPAVDNMADLVNDFEQRAKDYLEEKQTLHGR